MEANISKILCWTRYYAVIAGFTVSAGIFWAWVIAAVLEATLGISQHTATFFILPSVTAAVVVWGWKKVPVIFKLNKDECWKD